MKALDRDNGSAELDPEVIDYKPWWIWLLHPASGL